MQISFIYFSHTIYETYYFIYYYIYFHILYIFIYQQILTLVQLLKFFEEYHVYDSTFECLLLCILHFSIQYYHFHLHKKKFTIKNKFIKIFLYNYIFIIILKYTWFKLFN